MKGPATQTVRDCLRGLRTARLNTRCWITATTSPSGPTLEILRLTFFQHVFETMRGKESTTNASVK